MDFVPLIFDAVVNYINMQPTQQQLNYMCGLGPPPVCTSKDDLWLLPTTQVDGWASLTSL